MTDQHFQLPNPGGLHDNKREAHRKEWYRLNPQPLPDPVTVQQAREDMAAGRYITTDEYLHQLKLRRFQQGAYITGDSLVKLSQIPASLSKCFAFIFIVGFGTLYGFFELFAVMCILGFRWTVVLPFNIVRNRWRKRK